MVRKKSHKITSEFCLMSRVCFLCLAWLWSDKLSPVGLVREGCVEQVNCGEGEGVDWQRRGCVPGRVDGVCKGCWEEGGGPGAEAGASLWHWGGGWGVRPAQRAATPDPSGSQRAPTMPFQAVLLSRERGDLTHGILPAACFLNHTWKGWGQRKLKLLIKSVGGNIL